MKNKHIGFYNPAHTERLLTHEPQLLTKGRSYINIRIYEYDHSPRRWLHLGIGPVHIALFVSELRTRPTRQKS